MSANDKLSIAQIENALNDVTSIPLALNTSVEDICKLLADTMREVERLKKELHDIGFISNKDSA